MVAEGIALLALWRPQLYVHWRELIIAAGHLQHSCVIALIGKADARWRLEACDSKWRCGAWALRASCNLTVLTELPACHLHWC